MRNPRIYQAITPAVGEEVTLDDTAARHLQQVLRLREGAPFILFNGQNRAWQAQLLLATRQQVVAQIESELEANLESPLQIHLGLGISKGDRMDYAIQKAVELGVSEITPLFTRYSMVKLDEKRKEKRHQHWQGIIIGACEQCGRNKLPELHPAKENDTWLSECKADIKLTLDPVGARRLSEINERPSSLCLYIGPEGGLSEEEIAAARQAGFTGMQLGPRILRTETAVVSALTAAQLAWGDLG